MTMTLRILDCTLRDGGYYNNWCFPRELTEEYLRAMAAAQVDIVEIGFRNFPQASFLGPYAYSTDAFLGTLADEFRGLPQDTTEENLQARIRGTLLMALSNKYGSIVLTTGNKSEMAVGYSTLYGDMAGGFDVLKDVPKTLVFALARYRNSITAVIPQRVIDRPPSAELAPDQKDEDSLPPYDILDQILERYVERDLSANAIMADGFDAATVRRVVRLVDLNEYKRRQAAPGVKISSRNFGRDRRYPVTNRFRDMNK